MFGGAGCLSTHWTLLSAAESYSKPDLETPAMDQVFRGLGWQQGKDFESRVYEGADHNEASWRARLQDPLTFLMG